LIRQTHAAIVVAIAIGFIVTVTAAAAAAGPPDAMFVHGYNLCKVTSLAALNKATGKNFTKATNHKSFCIWSSGRGKYSIQVDTHPAGYIEFLGPTLGRHANGDVARAIAVPGASKAVLETFSHANTGRYAKDLFAAYPQGVVQVGLNYSTTLSDKVAVAVLRLVTHT
jgi:hypothetical protein